MVTASLLLYRRDRSQLTVVAIAFATLLVVAGLLAFVAILGAATVDSSMVDGRFMAPFRWDPSAALNLA